MTQRFVMRYQKIDKIYLLILIILPLILGAVSFRSYGESIDESGLYDYAAISSKAYKDLFILDFSPDLMKGSFRYYGPSFLMMAHALAKPITFFFPRLTTTDAWHFVYFLSYLTCVTGLFFMAKRWFSSWTSFSVSLMFLFQPMLWGHAFINPKDIPFMSFSLLTIMTGLAMQERLFPVTENWERPNISFFKQDWLQAKPIHRAKLLRGIIILAVVLAVRFAGQTWVNNTTAFFFTKIYNAKTDSLTARLFFYFAQHYQQIAMDTYLAKSVNIINIALLCFAGILLVWILWYMVRIFKTISEHINKDSVKHFTGSFIKYLFHPSILISGIMLGLTISIRILGPFMGLIVFVVAMVRAKEKALPAFTAYFLIAAFTTYITWPYLWKNPIVRFWKSVKYMSDFPWPGQVLFAGQYIPADKLPSSYVPVLLGSQLTEISTVLLVIGILLLIFNIRVKTVGTNYTIITLLWGVFPPLAFMAVRPPLYDNIRQLLFIMPPLFLIMALALERIFQHLRRPWIRLAILILMLLPGVYSIIKLHPYQYTYYNSFARAYDSDGRKFESDYWGTSFREATTYLNNAAPLNSKILVYGPEYKDLVHHFSRPDLFIDIYPGNSLDLYTGYDYAILTSRRNWDLNNFTNWQTVYTVQKNGVVFAVVKKQQ